LALAVAAGVVWVGAAASSPSAAGGATPAAAWTVYHHDPGGSGVDTSASDLSPVHRAWTTPRLDGQLYGEPLVQGGSVFIATENDTVYRLSAETGHVIWKRHLGTPVPASALPCGDISPTVGITSTPVIDPARREIFVVADEDIDGHPAHQLVGLSLKRGVKALNENVDPPAADRAAILNRVSLTLDGGRVVFGYGGNFGDCSTYHGWVVSVPEAGGPVTTYAVDAGPGQLQGAIWMGGAAPVVDGSGNIWVAAGNGSVTDAAGPYDGSDSVLELSPSLQLLQRFAPSSWFTDNALDQDLGSAVPAVLDNGLVVQGGKSQELYLLDQSKLGGVGGQLVDLSSVCAGNIDGGVAFVGSTVYLPCQSGLVAVKALAAPPSMTVLWKSAAPAGLPPIVAGGLVWVITASGSLDALRPSDGAVVQSLAVGVNANHFATPSAAGGRLFVTSALRLSAFAGPDS
jgi:outer membrane protein assembly factor BamB